MSAMKTARRVRDLSQFQLGRIVGMSEQIVARIEQGRRQVQVDEAIKIGAALRTDPMDLFPDLFEVSE